MHQRGAQSKVSLKSLAALRVPLTGSDVDERIPERAARETARVPGVFGAEVRLEIYAGRPHVVKDDEVKEARSLLESRL